MYSIKSQKFRNEIETRNTFEFRKCDTFDDVLNFNVDNLKINSGPLLMIYERFTFM